MSNVTTGVVVFSNIEETDTYQGKDTGWYSLTLALEPSEVSKLEDMGVKVKTYEPEEGEPVQQRKFKTRSRTTVVDLDDNRVNGEIPYGSKVRVLWATGEAHPQHGVPAYMNRVRIVELNEDAPDGIPEEF